MTETYILKLAIDDTAIKNLEQRLSQIMGIKGYGGVNGEGNRTVAQNLLKLTAIATGVGSVVTLVKKIADATVSSSPMLQQMFKLMDSSVSLILRPIGDFFGFILRPIMILMLQYVVLPFYRTFYPLAKTYGDAIGNFFTKDLRTILDWFTQNPLLATIMTSALAGLGLAGLFGGVVSAINALCTCFKGSCNCGTPSSPPPVIPPSIPPETPTPTKSPNTPTVLPVPWWNSLTKLFGGGSKQNQPPMKNTNVGLGSGAVVPLTGLIDPNQNTRNAYNYLRNLTTPINTSSTIPRNADGSVGTTSANNPLLQRITAMETQIQSWVNSGLQSLSSLPAALQKQLSLLPTIPGLGGIGSRPIIPDVFADTGNSTNAPQVHVTIGGNVYGVNDLNKAIADAVQQSFNRGGR